MDFLTVQYRFPLNHYLFTVPWDGCVCLSNPIQLQVGALGVGPYNTVSPSLLPISMQFLSLLCRGCSLSLSFSSGGITLSFGIDLMCLWEEVSSGPSYTIILGLSFYIMQLPLSVFFIASRFKLFFSVLSF